MCLHELVGWTIVSAEKKSVDVVLRLSKGDETKIVVLMPTWFGEVKIYERSPEYYEKRS